MMRKTTAPSGLCRDLEMIDGRIVVRADVDGPMVAIPAPRQPSSD
jgi:hypothetical protein